MPRAPQFRTSSLRELHRQLAYAPRETKRRLLQRAEELAAEVEPDRAYPEAFIVYRITSYRPEQDDEPVVLAGEALLADLSVFVQIISRDLQLPRVCAERGRALGVEEVAERLEVTARTLHRYRRRGLLLHFVDAGNRVQLACYETFLERFIERNRSSVDRARRFSRTDEEQARQIVEHAVDLHRQHGWNRQHIARHLARETGRSVETVRTLLSRYEEEGGRKIFAVRRRMSKRERRLIVRAWSIGCDAVDIAAHLDRSIVAVRRVINTFRIERVRGLDLRWIELPTFSLPDAEAVILEAPAAFDGLARPADDVDVLKLISSGSWKSGSESESEDLEAARIAAYNLLKKRARQHAETLDRNATDEQAEAIERDLRWAAALKRTLVASVLHIAIGRLDQHLHRPLVQQPAEIVRAMLRTAIDEISRTVEALNPAQGKVLQRVAALAIDRRLARGDHPDQPVRAGARHGAGAVMMHNPLGPLCEWQAALELPPRYARHMAILSEAQREVIDLLFGRVGRRPLSPDEIAESTSRSVRAVRARYRTGLRALRRACIATYDTDRVG